MVALAGGTCPMRSATSATRWDTGPAIAPTEDRLLRKGARVGDLQFKIRGCGRCNPWLCKVV